MDDVCVALGLTKKQRQILHRDIHNEDCDFHEMLERGRELFGK